MYSMPCEAIALLLHNLYTSVIDIQRIRDAFRRTRGFTDPAFLARVKTLSKEVDHLAFDASFMDDDAAMQALIAEAPEDVVDIFIYRFNLRMAAFRNTEGEVEVPDQFDFQEALRLFLIEDERIRNGSWSLH